jgi:hypothetical protein
MNDVVTGGIDLTCAAEGFAVSIAATSHNQMASIVLTKSQVGIREGVN